MNFTEKLEELSQRYTSSSGTDVLEMREDIFYHFSQLEDFEVLRVEATNERTCHVKAAVLSTMVDPFFKIVVAHKWQTDLAFDNEWHEFEENEQGVVFRFLTWDDEYISGEIWFQRTQREVNE